MGGFLILGEILVGCFCFGEICGGFVVPEWISRLLQALGISFACHSSVVFFGFFVSLHLGGGPWVVIGVEVTGRVLGRRWAGDCYRILFWVVG